MRTKLKRFFGILIILPILAGLFCGEVEACESKEECEETLAAEQEGYDELVALHEAFLDCCKQSDNEIEDWWGYLTDKRDKKWEDCEAIYEEASNFSGFIELEDIAEDLEEWRKYFGNEITTLKIHLHSFKEVNVKDILVIDRQKLFPNAKSFLDGVIDLLIKMVGVAALVFLVIGGFRLVVAAGNDNEIQKAKSMVQYAVIGLVVALLAYIIVAAVQGILYR